MFGRLMPKEGRFFDYFNDHASLVVEGAHELNAFLSDMSNREAHAQNVAFIEKKADKITHETINLLHQTFITPLDPAAPDVRRLGDFVYAGGLALTSAETARLHGLSLV